MNNSNGFTMIEVLVAMVILGVGILGMAGLQGVALQRTNSSETYSQAIKLAHDMAERMRANHTTVLASADNYKIEAGTEPTAPSVDCAATTCSDQELANHDRHQWWQAVKVLPSGNAAVTVDTAAHTADIRVFWDNERTGATGTACRSDADWNPGENLTCLELSIDL